MGPHDDAHSIPVTSFGAVGGAARTQQVGLSRRATPSAARYAMMGGPSSPTPIEGICGWKRGVNRQKPAFRAGEGRVGGRCESENTRETAPPTPHGEPNEREAAG